MKSAMLIWSNPGTAITKFRKFVESDRVDMVVGETFAHIGYALAPKADEYKMPTIFPVIASEGDTAVHGPPAGLAQAFHPNLGRLRQHPCGVPADPPRTCTGVRDAGDY